MNSGLDKLVEASESVSMLSKELVEKEKELEVASAEADKVSHYAGTMATFNRC